MLAWDAKVLLVWLGLQEHHWGVAYPLRPEVVESTYLLHAASHRPRHLRAGAGILETLWTRNRCKCGFCAVGNVTSGDD
jgi:hypothetical protein